jgi:AcrR family transcriptional regulator
MNNLAARGGKSTGAPEAALDDDSETAAVRVLRSAAERGELTEEGLRWALDRLGDGRRSAPRPDTQGRRADILQAATRLFASRGYHAATLQDIADELALTRPAFYYYFKSKQQILEAICREAIDAADAALEEVLQREFRSLKERLRVTLYTYAAHAARAETTAIMMRNFDEMSEVEKDWLRNHRRMREQKLVDLVREGAAAGEFSVREPLIGVLTIFEAIHAIHNWYRPGGRLTREEVSRIIVDQQLDGFLGPAEGAEHG